MEQLGVLPAEWERSVNATEVANTNGFVKNHIYGEDTQLFVRFDYMPEAIWHEIDGERVVKDVVKKEYVWIQRAGDKLQVYHQRAKNRHKRRFPKHYEAFRSGKEQGMLGIPLINWDYQLANFDIQSLRLMGIEYVHQLASLSDSMLPVLGVNGKIWRAAAQVTMSEFANKQKRTELQLELNERDKQLAELKEEANGTKAQLNATLDEIAQLRRLFAERGAKSTSEVAGMGAHAGVFEGLSDIEQPKNISSEEETTVKRRGRKPRAQALISNLGE